MVSQLFRMIKESQVETVEVLKDYVIFGEVEGVEEPSFRQGITFS